jgi:hypothetical protein
MIAEGGWMSKVCFRLYVRLSGKMGVGVPYEQVSCETDDDESLDEENYEDGYP